MTASGGVGMVCAKCGMTGMTQAVTVNGLIVCDWCKPEKMSESLEKGYQAALAFDGFKKLLEERDRYRQALVSAESFATMSPDNEHEILLDVLKLIRTALAPADKGDET